MIRISYRKVIPQVILAIILLIYFISDITLGITIISSAIKNNCVIPQLQQIQCSTKPVKIDGHESLILGISNEGPTVKYTVNRDKEEIALNESYFRLLLSSGAYVDQFDPESTSSVFSYIHEMDRVYFTDKRVVLKEIGDNKTEVTLNYDRAINEGYMFNNTVTITDANGRSALSWQNGTTGKTYVNYLIASYAYLFQFLVWWAALFGTSFKSSIWSTVYNSETKEPILGAVIRIFKEGKLFVSFVTGETGVLYTKLTKGIYSLAILHPQFKFPSKLAPMPKDGEYKNLYYGGNLEIKKDNSPLKINIPLDPAESLKRTSFVKKASTAFLSTIESSNSSLIILLVVCQIILWPTFVDTWVFAFVGGSLLGIQYYQRKKNKKIPGLLLDTEGNKLANMKINLYDGEWQRRIDSKVTNQNGEYEFIVPNAKYYLGIEDSRYIIQGADPSGRYLINAKEENIKTLYINEKLVLLAVTQPSLNTNIPVQPHEPSAPLTQPLP